MKELTKRLGTATSYDWGITLPLEASRPTSIFGLAAVPGDTVFGSLCSSCLPLTAVPTVPYSFQLLPDAPQRLFPVTHVYGFQDATADPRGPRIS